MASNTLLRRNGNDLVTNSIWRHGKEEKTDSKVLGPGSWEKGSAIKTTVW